jgi:uncharacterized membrane protein
MIPADPTRATFWSFIRSSFGRGVVIIVPVVITIWVLNIVFLAVDGIASPLFEVLLGQHIPGIGFVSMLVLILILGAISRNLIGRSIMGFLETVITRLPLARTIYSAVRDMMKSFSKAGEGKSFRDVVIIEYPRKGVATIGFATNNFTMSDSELPADMVSVYLPNPPNPTSGFLVLVPRESVKVLDMSIEEGLKLVLSGGIVTTGNLTIRGDRGKD